MYLWPESLVRAVSSVIMESQPKSWTSIMLSRRALVNRDSFSRVRLEFEPGYRSKVCVCSRTTRMLG